MLSTEETTAVQTFLTKQSPQDARIVMGGRGSSSQGRAAGTGTGVEAKTGPLGEKVGDRLEVSGESIIVVKEVAERIAKDG